jgi:hypothetical protein
MSKFFGHFPTIPYDISKGDITTYQNPTNIFFRVGMIKEALESVSSYYIYIIKDGEKPETLADKVYGSSEAHWIILMANERLDGSYDWPLNYNEFNNHIADKYRSAAGGPSLTDNQVISWSQNTTPTSNSIHHFEKVIDRTDVASNITTTFRYAVDYDKKSDTPPSGVPYDYYLNVTEGDYQTYTVNGKTVNEKTYRNLVTIYDYEYQLNESKREIKVIKPEYYGSILDELKKMAGVKTTTRKLRLR